MDTAKPPAAAAPKPQIDKQAAPVAQTAKVVMSMSDLQSQAGRLNRLRALARTNRDVAWLIELAGDKFGVEKPEAKPKAKPAPTPKAKAPKQSRTTHGESAEQHPDEIPDAGDVSGEFEVPTGGGKGA